MQGVALLDLSPNGCRFPVNYAGKHEPHLFCNAGRIQGLPYCPYHCEMAFVGVSKIKPIRPSRPLRRAA